MDFHTLPLFPGGSDTEPSQRERHADVPASDRVVQTLLFLALAVLFLLAVGFLLLVLTGAGVGAVVFYA